MKTIVAPFHRPTKLVILVSIDYFVVICGYKFFPFSFSVGDYLYGLLRIMDVFYYMYFRGMKEAILLLLKYSCTFSCPPYVLFHSLHSDSGVASSSSFIYSWRFDDASRLPMNLCVVIDSTPNSSSSCFATSDGVTFTSSYLNSRRRRLYMVVFQFESLVSLSLSSLSRSRLLISVTTLLMALLDAFKPQRSQLSWVLVAPPSLILLLG